MTAMCLQFGFSSTFSEIQGGFGTAVFFILILVSCHISVVYLLFNVIKFQFRLG